MEIAMEKLLITKEQLDAQGYYTASDSIDFEGQIHIAAGLGSVKFRGQLIASLSIIVESGSGIEAGLRIEAGDGIKAGLQILAKTIISTKLRIFAGLCLRRVPKLEETTIRAQRVEGTVCYGKVELLPAGTKKAAARK